MRAQEAKVKNLNVRVGEEQYEAIRQFATFNGQSLSSFILNTLLEKIEDEEDVRDYLEYKKKGDSKKHSLDEVMREYDL